MKTHSPLLPLAATLALAVAAPVCAQTQPARFHSLTYEGADPATSAPLAPGQYRNPILTGFYPDPSVTRVGEDYYLVTSTFSYFPGIPVFHSRDLVNWTQIGNAIDRPGQLDFAALGLSRGVFAPTIEHHDGTFYILNTCVDCGGNFLITATDPAGPWSDPVWLPELHGGIDPSLFVDQQGQAWILNNGPPEGEPQYDGHRAIWIQRYDLERQVTFGPRTVLVNGGVDFSTKPIWIEGPHLIFRNGWYYLTCAEGGTAEGHSQVVLRARAPDGPFVAFEGNPILTQKGLPGDRPYPITSAGHADLVQTPDGNWWATFLAVRPYGPDQYNTGRETFLMPVDWSGEWPIITVPDQVIPYQAARPDLPEQPAPAVPTGGPFRVVDSFDGPGLPTHWMMMRNPRETWFDLAATPGALSLTPRPVDLGDNGNPSFLGRRQQHQYATAETTMDWTPARDGDRAGLVALQSDDWWYFLAVGREAGETVIQLRRRAGPDEAADGVVMASAPLSRASDATRLRITARADRYDFAFAGPGGGWTDLMTDVDGTILSTRTAGGFVGVVFGPHARSGH
ncbi:MAG: glycoside hydrolase family 43 protein [Brevundimonas sp.]|uniref:glycoside hydrolase family 43 protein n=1 Tax=Brevundimonas sp. TaxID=1871086 RepID=UPI0027338068|nr:glycoside hydrolase family 43 protein [Brevundimonas sp.]MDP3404175.1 glycoside hydrolase family 43 protein [Brevundimonas sp.]